MTFVTGLRSVTVVSGGEGYFVDEPIIEFIPPVGRVPSVIASANLVRNGGSILSVDMVTYGSGYQQVDSTLAVSTAVGVDANLTPVVDSLGAIQGVNINNPGTGYQVGDQVTATRAVTPITTLLDAIMQVSAVDTNGAILAVAITRGGQGYQPSVTTVRIISRENPAVAYPVGAGFSATPVVDGTGQITQVVINNPGAGYADLHPYLAISNQGTGAVTSVTLTGDAVSSVAVTTPGSGYVLPVSGSIFNPPTALLPNPPATPATVTIAISENTAGTNPNLYWQVWSGAATNKQIQLQLNQVLSYFKQLGYTIEIHTNPQTGSTITWLVCW